MSTDLPLTEHRCAGRMPGGKQSCCLREICARATQVKKDALGESKEYLKVKVEWTCVHPEKLGLHPGFVRDTEAAEARTAEVQRVMNMEASLRKQTRRQMYRGSGR